MKYWQIMTKSITRMINTLAEYYFVKTLTYNYKNMKLYDTVSNDWKKWFAWYPVELQT